MIGNARDRFGLLTRLLHWAVAALVLTTLPLGRRIATMPPALDTLWLFGLHKSIGITILSLTVLRLAWHRTSPPPPPIAGVPGWQMRLARTTHRGLYALAVLTPVSGWVASSATGIDTVIFGRWTLPAIAPVSETWEDAGFAVHGALAALLALAVLLHVAGALHRSLQRRDGTLRRMILGR